LVKQEPLAAVDTGGGGGVVDLPAFGKANDLPRHDLPLMREIGEVV
jgi:hypothetical protein